MSRPLRGPSAVYNHPTLMIGTTLSHFKITAKLGEGGMGEVYLAEDLKLGREVAIKVLPADFVEDEERLARFEREAKVLASLNHPKIAAIYSLESAERAGTEAGPYNEAERAGTEAGASKGSPPKVRFLVMELVEGQDLSERLAGGSIPTDEALNLAHQIAEALQAAHAQSVVHRDLKPANIKVTPGHQVKVLDFGLAKAWDAPGSSDLTRSPTLTAQMTQAGMIMGTASYMSPEQARAQDVDKRSDIWSFGVVLFEMLTGGRIFPGDTVTDILGAIVHKEPEWERLPADLPPGIHRLLRRCLEKDLDKRLQDIGDARIEIDEALAGGPETVAPEPAKTEHRRLRWLPWAVAAAAVVLASWSLLGRPAPAPDIAAAGQVHQMTLLLPETQTITYDGQSIAISPDGRSVAYCASSGLGNQVHVRRLESRSVVSLEGTEGCGSVFFSPDGQSIGILHGTGLFRAPLDGGTPVRISGGGTFAVGASWGDDDSIVMVRDWGSGLSRVEARGGEPESLTTPDAEAGEGSHLWPEVLPSSQTVLYTVWSADRGGQTSIYSLDLATRESQILLENARAPRYSKTGHLLFMRGDHLMVAAFDSDRLQVLGTPAPLATDTRLYSDTYGAVFDVSDQGTLIYQGGGRWEQKRRIAWVDRTGQIIPAVEDERDFDDPEISPDGNRIVVTVRGPVFTIWVYDLEAGTRTKLQQDGDSGGAVWLPGGNEILFWSNMDGPYAIYRQDLAGSSSPEIITQPLGGDIDDIAASADGRFVAFESVVDGGKGLIYVDLADGRESKSFLETPDNETGPAFSPDGRWLAFVSDESGQAEVHVAAFPGPGPNWMISSGGGILPRWSPDGRELYYIHSKQLFAVGIEPGEQLRVGRTERLFESDRLVRNYSVAKDGRFLMLERVEVEGPERHQIDIVLNWPSTLSP